MLELLMFIGIAILAVFIFSPLLVLMFQTAFYDVDIGGKLTEWRWKMKNRKTRNKPLYERVALAHEWQAEQCFSRGDIDGARRHLRKAEQVRKEALDNMMNGQEPTI